MDIKCIALDLDGTTLYDDKHLSPRTEAAIRQAAAAGVQFVVASGRCLGALPRSVLDLEAVQYAITSNGAAVYHFPTKTYLRQLCLPADFAETLLDLARGIHCTFEVFCYGQGYADAAYMDNPPLYGVSAAYAQYVQTTRTRVDDIRAFLLEHREELEDVDILLPDAATTQALSQQLTDSGCGVYVTSSVSTRVEIVSTRAGKHSGLALVLDTLGIRPEETAAFGNADNDVDMLRYAGCSFAVADASESCLAAADHIVPHHLEDGVAIGIEGLLQGKY